MVNIEGVEQVESFIRSFKPQETFTSPYYHTVLNDDAEGLLSNPISMLPQDCLQMILLRRGEMTQSNANQPHLLETVDNAIEGSITTAARLAHFASDKTSKRSVVWAIAAAARALYLNDQEAAGAQLLDLAKDVNTLIKPRRELKVVRQKQPPYRPIQD